MLYYCVRWGPLLQVEVWAESIESNRVFLLGSSTVAYVQIDGELEKMIQKLENMFRACVLDCGGTRINIYHLWSLLIIIVQCTIEMTPLEALYGRKCKSPICWKEVGDLTISGYEIIDETTQKIKLIYMRIEAAQSR